MSLTCIYLINIVLLSHVVRRKPRSKQLDNRVEGDEKLARHYILLYFGAGTCSDVHSNQVIACACIDRVANRYESTRVIHYPAMLRVVPTPRKPDPRPDPESES